MVHEPKRIVLTGGPGAGKTAVLEVVRRSFCRHVVVLPEAASILFQGGFPRRSSAAARTAIQRAIYRVQAELEQMALDEHEAGIVLCDRGTIDGLAYWPHPDRSPWSELGTSQAAELARYAAVIHLHTPAADRGYDHSNPARVETAEEAAMIDARILHAWEAHPRRTLVAAEDTFLRKLEAAVEAIRCELPPCCRGHRLAPRGATPIARLKGRPS